MKVYEILDKVDYEKLYKSIEKKKNMGLFLFKRTVDDLKNLMPYLNDIQINIKKINDEMVVYGYKEGDTQTIPLELYNWQTWLGMTISQDFLNKGSLEEILEYILYEMTFVSFEDAFQKTNSECLYVVNNIQEEDYERFGVDSLKLKKLRKKIKSA